MNVLTCSVDGCASAAGIGKRANRDGMCVKHLTRFKRHGDPHADFTRRPTVRFEVNDEGCHIWSGQKNQGYGVVKVAGKRLRAHRWVWSQRHGPIPDGVPLDHTCHNRALAEGRCKPGPCRHRACVNEDHLELTTTGENVRRSKRTQTHCKSGHEFTPENTRMSGGHRVCLACRYAKGWT